MKFFALPALLALTFLPSCSRDPLTSLQVFEGEWSGTHKILGEDGEHPASYSVHREDGVLVWNFQSGFQGGFTGRALQRWDKKRGLFIEAWTDSMTPDAATEIAGTYDSNTRVLLMSGEAPDWVTGAPVHYRHQTTIVSQNEWNYVMQQAAPDGGSREVRWIHMIRRP